MVNNFMREGATEGKTTYILLHLGQLLVTSLLLSILELLQCLQHLLFLRASAPATPDLCVCKQSLMQQQHFSILFLYKLIINIDH